MGDCKECASSPCLFDEFRTDYVETVSWAVQKDLVLGKIEEEGYDVNRALCKRLFGEFTKWRGTMTKPRTRHPTCVEKGVMKIYPSKYYMGFKRDRDKENNNAVDIDGKKVETAKWVKTDNGKYNVEVEDT